MSDEVEVEYGDNPGDQATLLLAAASELGLDPSVVKVTSHGSSGGSFTVPAEVNEKAFGGDKPAAKKAAKKAPAKK